MHRAAGRGHVRAETLVVFDVAAGQFFRGSVVELGEQVGRHLAERIDQHVEPATVGHTDHYFLHALHAGLVDQLVHRHDEAFATFERKALLTDVLGVQKALEALSCREAIQHMLLLLDRQLRVGARAFELLLPPALVVLVGRVHVLGADGAAVRFTQGVEQIAQRHGVFAEERVAGVEHRFEVGVSKAVERRFEFRDSRAFCALERVEIGPACTDVAVRGNELLHCRALAAEFGVGTAGLHHASGALLGPFGKGIDDRQMRHVFGVAAVGGRHVLQGVEVRTPGVGHAAGIREVVFIHLFDIGRIAAEEIGVALIGLIRRGRRKIAHIPLTFASLEEALAG